MDFVPNNLDKTKILRYEDIMKQKYILPPSLDHELLGNYKPISHLKVAAKIIKKVVTVRLQDYIESNELNEPLQSDYKRFPSCETTLTRVHNDILLKIDHRHCVVLLLLLHCRPQ